MLYFENSHCERCGHTLGFLERTARLETLVPVGGNVWSPLGAPRASERYRFCANANVQVCNWLVDADGNANLCRACSLNQIIPDLRVFGNQDRWRKLESAKHRLVYSLLKLKLPLYSKAEDAWRGLAFEFLGDPNPRFREGPAVMTGHLNGIVTLNIAEADDAERERQRATMAEPYRTLLGHFRHEVGHYYWAQLVAPSQWVQPFRDLFGDERTDYEQALDTYYAGAAGPWQTQYVSAYASSHPWEDWAETWAHYLHIVDVLETAYAYGISIRPRAGRSADLTTRADFDAYRMSDFDALVQAWLPLTYAMNSINRSMGQPDLYPFVLASPVLDKLRFVHNVIRQSRSSKEAAV